MKYEKRIWSDERKYAVYLYRNLIDIGRLAFDSLEDNITSNK